MTLTYAKLIKAHPEDAVCAFCEKKNEHWDEDGFFYLWTRPEMAFQDGEAACKACINGEPGKLHMKLHGKGSEGR